MAVSAASEEENEQTDLVVTLIQTRRNNRENPIAVCWTVQGVELRGEGVNELLE
jgi:hypothetical protein